MRSHLLLLADTVKTICPDKDYTIYEIKTVAYGPFDTDLKMD